MHLTKQTVTACEYKNRTQWKLHCLWKIPENAENAETVLAFSVKPLTWLSKLMIPPRNLFYVHKDKDKGGALTMSEMRENWKQPGFPPQDRELYNGKKKKK